MGRRGNGEGTWGEKNGKITLRKMLGYKPNGKPDIRTVSGGSKKECLEKMKQLESEIAKLNYCDFENTSTLAELCRMHLNYDLGLNDKLKRSAADRRECTIRNQIEGYQIGNYQAVEIRAEEIKDYVEELFKSPKGNSASNVKKAFDVINAAYNWAKKRRLLSENPCDLYNEEIRDRIKKMDLKTSAESEVVVLSDDEVKRFISEVSQKDYKGNYIYEVARFALLLLFSGIRCSELCALKWKDYDSENGFLSIRNARKRVKLRDDNGNMYVAKNGSHSEIKEELIKNLHARTIELNYEARKFLDLSFAEAKRNKPNDYIVYNGQGRAIESHEFYDRLKTVYRNAGIECSGSHVFRRTFATKLYEDTNDIKYVANYLGDTPETILKHYISVKKKIKKGDTTINVVPYKTKK